MEQIPILNSSIPVTNIFLLKSFYTYIVKLSSAVFIQLTIMVTNCVKFIECLIKSHQINKNQLKP